MDEGCIDVEVTDEEFESIMESFESGMYDCMYEDRNLSEICHRCYEIAGEYRFSRDDEEDYSDNIVYLFEYPYEVISKHITPIEPPEEEEEEEDSKGKDWEAAVSTRYYVLPCFKEDRERFVQMLLKNGFSCRTEFDNTVSSTIDSVYPMVIELDDMKFGHLVSTLGAAGAASAGRIMSVEEFLSIYESMCQFVIV